MHFFWPLFLREKVDYDGGAACLEEEEREGAKVPHKSCRSQQQPASPPLLYFGRPPPPSAPSCHGKKFSLGELSFLPSFLPLKPTSPDFFSSPPSKQRRRRKRRRWGGVVWGRLPPSGTVRCSANPELCQPPSHTHTHITKGVYVGGKEAV